MLNNDKRFALGSSLAVIGGTGTILFPMMDSFALGSPWSFLLGFIFGVSTGIGVPLTVLGLAKVSDD